MTSENRQAAIDAGAVEPESPPGAAEPGRAATPLISVVTPAHNEEAALPMVIGLIVGALGACRHEVVVVDDGSTDETWCVIERLRQRFPVIRGVRLTRNFGHQAAIIAGLEASRGEAVITMDSDGQHPPALIPRLIERWREGFPVVQGVRVGNPDEGPLKRLTSRLFYRVLRTLSGVPVSTGSADFRLLSRQVVDAVLRGLGPLVFLRGLIPWLGFRTAEVAFEAERRVAGRASYTWGRMISLSVEGVLSFSIMPLRAAVVIGGITSGAAFLYLGYVGIVWVLGDVVPGWASVAGLMSLLGGMQLLTIGILGEYLGRLFLANLGRPHFVVRDRL